MSEGRDTVSKKPKNASEMMVGIYMEHLSEVVKILDAALMHDTAKATAYANLLASKLDDDKQVRQARAVRSVLAKLPNDQVQTSQFRPQVPQDLDGALPTVDYSLPSEFAHPELILHPYVKDRIDEFLQSVRMHDVWVAEGIAASNRLLIYGPPGTGKTSLARVVAKELDLPLVVSRSDALVSSLLGQTSRNIRNIFHFAESNPCVLFLDEFDALAKNRKDAREIGELQRVVIALLQNIDALSPSCILIAATNHPELLDPAVWRRFDYTIEVGLPDAGVRASLWASALGRFAPSEAELRRLAELSEGMSGAAVRVVANDVCRAAIMGGGAAPGLPLIIRRLARLLWYDKNTRFDNDHAEIAALREWAPDVFTVRVLSELFGVSTRQVGNAIRGAGLAENGVNSTVARATE